MVFSLKGELMTFGDNLPLHSHASTGQFCQNANFVMTLQYNRLNFLGKFKIFQGQLQCKQILMNAVAFIQHKSLFWCIWKLCELF